MPVGPARGTRPVMFGHFGRAYIARQTETDVSVSAGALFKQDSKIARVRVRVDGRVRDSSAVVAIVVGPPAKIDTFTSNVATRVAGGSVTLTWTTTGATSVLINGDAQTAVDGNTSVTIPATALTGDVITYVLEASNHGRPWSQHHGHGKRDSFMTNDKRDDKSEAARRRGPRSTREGSSCGESPGRFSSRLVTL